MTNLTDTLTLIAAFLLGVLAVARATRLLVHDSWPPLQALRLRWLTWCAQTERREPWGDLLTCPFCAAPYVTAVTLAVAVAADVWEPDLSTLTGWWWVLAVWAAVSYLAAMTVVRDEPAEE